MNLSARVYHYILKLAHTIADLAGEERIQTAHIAEAIYLPSAAADGVIYALAIRTQSSPWFDAGPAGRCR